MAEQVQQKNPVRLLLAILVVGIGLYLLIGGLRAATDNKSPLVTPNKTAITIETVSSDEDRRMGLSGRSSIGDREGMLFRFDTASTENCFWMKDMQFAIDMVWLNEDKQVVTVIEDVSPETYPESFCPEQPALYGLEVAALRAVELDIQVGKELKF